MPDKQLFTFRNPVGVVAAITAGNFPVAVPAWYLVPALLCGNAVVWKPADYSPACGEALFELFVRGGGLPDGVLNLVHRRRRSRRSTVSPQALDDGLVDKVGFTGSSAVGAKIGELTGRHLQSAVPRARRQEPDGRDADADLDLAAEGALFSGFGTAGQRCTSLGTVIVHESVHDDFLRAIRQAHPRRPAVGDPTEGVVYGPMLDEKFGDQFEEYLGWIAAPPHACTARPRPAGSRPTTRATASSAIPMLASSTTR